MTLALVELFCKINERNIINNRNVDEEKGKPSKTVDSKIVLKIKY